MGSGNSGRRSRRTPGEPPEIDLRFKVGDRVECCVARGPDGWRPGTIISLWYRAVSWPTGQFAPYQIKLDDHQSLIFAPQDRDNCIRKAQEADAANDADLSVPT